MDTFYTNYCWNKVFCFEGLAKLLWWSCFAVSEYVAVIMFRVTGVEGECSPYIKPGSFSLDCMMLHALTFSLKDLYVVYFVSCFISCFCYCFFYFVLCFVVYFSPHSSWRWQVQRMCWNIGAASIYDVPKYWNPNIHIRFSECYCDCLICSKLSLIWLQLIQMLDNVDRNMKNALHSWVHALKDTWYLGRQMSHLSIQTKLDSFFKPALLCSKTSTTSESSIDE
jgi:hypothetical protein